MRLSLGLTTGMPIKECIKYAERAELLKYYRIWVGEDIFSREIFTFLSILALKTEKIKLATGITSIYARNHAVFLSSVKGMQKLAGGRFSLGLGIGGLPEIEKLLGSLPKNKLNEMSKSIKAVKKLDPSLKIYLGARGEKMLKLGAVRCDGVILSGPKSYIFDSVEMLKKMAEEYRKKLEFILWNPILIANENMIDTILASLPETALKYIKSKSRKEIVDELCIAEEKEEIIKEIKKFEKAGISELVVTPESLAEIASWNLE